MLPNEVFVLLEYKYTARFCDAVLPFYDFWEYKRSARCVVASFVSFVPPQAAGLNHSAASPSPKKPYGFPGTPNNFVVYPLISSII